MENDNPNNTDFDPRGNEPGTKWMSAFLGLLDLFDNWFGRHAYCAGNPIICTDPNGCVIALWEDSEFEQAFSLYSDYLRSNGLGDFLDNLINSIDVSEKQEIMTGTRNKK